MLDQLLAGVGFGSSCGRLGAVVAPFVLEMSSEPFLVFAALSLLAGATVWMLTETKGKSLKD